MNPCARCGAAVVAPGSVCETCEDATADPVAARARDVRDQEPAGAAGLLLDPRFWRASPPTGRRRPQRSETHSLVPPFGAGLELEIGRTLVLGRDAGCDIRLDSPSVSRHHAQLVVRGDPARAFVKNLSATNVTRLNGVPVSEERSLADGDVLRFGEVTAIYRRGAAAEPSTFSTPNHDPAQRDETIPIGEVGKRALSGLAGDVSLYPMADLLGRLTVMRATGRFVVEVDGMSGHARFAKGTIRESRFAGCRGAEATKLLSMLTRGRFRFEPAPEG